MSTRKPNCETLTDIRGIDVFVEADWKERLERNDISSETRELCHAILVAADVVRRTIIAVHDQQEQDQFYNP